MSIMSIITSVLILFATVISYAHAGVAVQSKQVSSADSPATSSESGNVFHRLSSTIGNVIASTKGKKTISASTATVINGVEGLNLKIDFPVKIGEAILGFRYKLKEAKRVPDTLFLRRSFHIGDGTTLIDADYELGINKLKIAANWVSDKLGIKLSAVADSDDHLTDVGVYFSRSIADTKFVVSGDYNTKTRKTNNNVWISCNILDYTSTDVHFKNGGEDVVLSVSEKISSRTTFTPSISAASKAFTFDLLRKLDAGYLKLTYKPKKNVVIEWKDNGASGFWKTKLAAPVEDFGNSKLSITREWTY